MIVTNKTINRYGWLYIPNIEPNAVKEAERELNIILSTGYISLINLSTNYMIDFLAKASMLQIPNGRFKTYLNKTKAGMKKLEMTFKYNFPNLQTWQKNIELTDAICDMADPYCKQLFQIVSSELKKKKIDDHLMLSYMIVSAVILRKAALLFDEMLKSARRRTTYNFRPYFNYLNAECLEHPFAECVEIVVDHYGIDVQEIMNLDDVKKNIAAIDDVMGNPNTYNKALEKVEKQILFKE